ncbi:hypothetical protein TRFO_08560 [Tritrichomonas foetus]|uniref:Uncharacterized protein n=1 Tax=Tritrichomonas foetus TaxID=1144522 RepID=A0A1J4JKT9_9EUKA|nr:hypothetical protein TRFO_08560 [Tritrichomonas foetus]|eukprot:OHS99015.1 hypothetical protein TRFO_08560 [Tritrichomonas foetus]
MSSAKELNWRIAFSDKTTGMASVPQCLTSGDVFGDGSNRILIVSLDQKLICFEGPRITHEITLPDMPSSICVHYSGKAKGGIPLVAVGAGNSILFFLNMREYSKFTLPPPFKSKNEKEIYDQFESGSLTLSDMQRELLSAKERNVQLCQQSIAFLRANLSTKAANDRWRQSLTDVTSSDCITTLSSIKINAVTDDLSTRLLIGTESRTLLLLDVNDQNVEKKWELGAPPSVIKTSGYLSGTSLIAVVTRDRTLRLISNMADEAASVNCESLPVDVSICAGNVYVALMSKLVKIFDSTGKLIETVAFDSHIISLVSISIESRQLQCCCVATESGELTFLDRSTRISTLKVDEGISAMFYGQVGREPYNLLTISKQGGLFLRTLSRVPHHSKNENKTEEPPAAIPIPKKTKLFLDKCDYERNNAPQMHKEWRNSLRYLYLLAANTYAQILDDSVVPSIEDVSFSVKIAGMGPEFVMNVQTVNSGSDVISMVKVIPKYNPKMYKVSPDFVNLPPMVGGYQYSARFSVKSIDKEGKSDTINVIATSPISPTPLCSSVVQIPVSQFPVE